MQQYANDEFGKIQKSATGICNESAGEGGYDSAFIWINLPFYSMG
jgi:hypothetical protein